MNTVLAIPSNNPGGLNAEISPHFGHCDLYTIIGISDNQIKSIETMENPPHKHGGCLAPVSILANRGVKKLLASGIGKRPLMGFNEAGIEVFFAGRFSTVEQSIKAFLNNELSTFSIDSVCGGSEGCGGH